MYKEELKNNMKLLEEYKKAVDAGSIVSKTNLKGEITFANDEFCKISGYTQEELLGKNHNIVRHPDVSAAVYKDLWKTIKAKEIWKGKIKNRAKDGSSYYVTVTIVPILDSQNTVVEYLALRQDVTQLEELNHFLEKRVSQEVEKNRKKDEQSIATLSAFLENSPNPIIVYDGKKVQYANSKFLRLTNKEKHLFIGSEFSLDSLFQAKPGYISSLAEIDTNSKINKISLASAGAGRNIYNIFISDIPFLNDVSLKMYTLNNITTIEYQKLKIYHYNLRLEDFIKKSRKGNSSDKAIFEALSEEKISHTKSEDENTIEKTSKEKRVLNKQELNVLKKSRQSLAVSSQDYSANLDDYTLETNEDLAEIEDDIYGLIKEFNEEKNFAALGKISEKLLNYATFIALLVEFEDLSYAVNSLGELLQTVQTEDIDESTHKKIELYLSNILLDLSTWRRNVFIDQAVNDIHYLDSSLFSTILQFELIFNKIEITEDEDDFEMF